MSEKLGKIRSEFLVVDIRNYFKNISVQMLAEFEASSEINHAGGKGSVREDSLASFLRTYVPRQYGIGRGEVVTAENRHSGQLDIIIYDAIKCPILLPSDAHSIFPVESVFGAISVKSRLNSQELADAYKNIASLKQIVPNSSFTHSTGIGFASGLSAPIPVTGIFAYAADRSIEAIAAQALKLDAETDKALRPDFISVLNEGIIASRAGTRGEFNRYSPPQDPNALRAIRKTGRLTLLRMYMELLRDLNLIHLRPFNLSAYDKMPKLVGPYRVSRHDHFVWRHITTNVSEGPMRLTEAAIRKIVCESMPMTLREHYKHTLGDIEISGLEKMNLDAIVYEFNPNNLPPMNFNSMQKDAAGHPHFSEPGFYAVGIDIDGKTYAVDLSVFAQDKEYWEQNPDLTIDELFAL